LRPASIVLALVVTVSASKLSPVGESAAEKWVVGDASRSLPPRYVGAGTRRFPSQVITYRLVQPTSRQADYAREAVVFWASVLGNGVRFVEVQEEAASAQIVVRYANSWTVPGIGVIPIRCGASPFELEPDRVTYRLGYVLSNEKKGCDSRYIVLHEFGHLFTTFGHPPAGIMSKTCVGCPSWNGRLTPAQNAAQSGWEGVPGLFEASQWAYTVPAGSRPSPNSKYPVSR
jgi:hypothetical protein